VLELNWDYMDCLRTLTTLSEDTQCPGETWWYPATLNWLNDHPSYCSWLESHSPSVLHFHGKARSGKSTLLSYILDKLQTTTFSSQTSIVFFAFDRSGQRRNTTQAMLLSFTRQLLLLQPSLFSSTNQHYMGLIPILQLGN
jgi:hypothetical protein